MILDIAPMPPLIWASLFSTPRLFPVHKKWEFIHSLTHLCNQINLLDFYYMAGPVVATLNKEDKGPRRQGTHSLMGGERQQTNKKICDM